MRRINEMDIRFFTRVRTGIEIDLAKTMYDLFNAQPIIGLLRDGVYAVLETVIADIDFASPAYVNEIPNLLLFKSKAKGQTGRAALDVVLAGRRDWSASDCSDLIRLVATLVEKGGQGFAHKGVQAVTSGQQLGQTFKPGTSFGNVVGTPATPNWSGRSRWDTVKTPQPPAGYVPPPRHVIEGRNQIEVERLVLQAALDLEETKGRRERVSYGIRDNRLMPHSTVRKIDIAFGLPQGADISGTTADSIIVFKQVRLFSNVLEQAASVHLPEAILQLLPLATMVSLGHHTLLESALTLTLSGFINYSIGFYSTVMPNPHDRRGIDEEVSGQMMRALRNAEAHQGNRHFIAYAAGNKYEGLLYETDAELEEFLKFSWVADPFREEMGSLSAHVPQDQLLDVVNFLGRRRITY